MIETTRVILEDDPRLGPWFSPMLSTVRTPEWNLHEISAAQLERWQLAEQAWKAAQDEMQDLMQQRLRERSEARAIVEARDARQRAAVRAGAKQR